MEITTTQTSRQYSLKGNMESAAEKKEQERKREVSLLLWRSPNSTMAKLLQYFRLAQREFPIVPDHSHLSQHH
jgi:hypothetical protein